MSGAVALERMRSNIARGLKISVLTNSLAATDEPVVHTGYRRYRDNMLKNVPFRLHTMSVVLDQKVAFIGSMNLDARSEEHNTELGILVRNPALARDMHKIITLFRNDAAYEVRLSPGSRRNLEWFRIDELDAVLSLDEEPDVDAWTRWKVNILSVLIPESLL